MASFNPEDLKNGIHDAIEHIGLLFSYDFFYKKKKTYGPLSVVGVISKRPPLLLTNDLRRTVKCFLSKKTICKLSHLYRDYLPLITLGSFFVVRLFARRLHYGLLYTEDIKNEIRETIEDKERLFSYIYFFYKKEYGPASVVVVISKRSP